MILESGNTVGSIHQNYCTKKSDFKLQGCQTYACGSEGLTSPFYNDTQDLEVSYYIVHSNRTCHDTDLLKGENLHYHSAIYILEEVKSKL